MLNFVQKRNRLAIVAQAKKVIIFPRGGSIVKLPLVGVFGILVKRKK